MDTTIHLGDILALAGVIVTLFLFHSSNVQRISQMDRRLQDRAVAIETKMELIYKWFTKNILKGEE